MKLPPLLESVPLLATRVPEERVESFGVAPSANRGDSVAPEQALGKLTDHRPRSHITPACDGTDNAPWFLCPCFDANDNFLNSYTCCEMQAQQGDGVKCQCTAQQPSCTPW